MPMLLDDPHFTMELTDNGIVFVTVIGDFDDETVDRFDRESEPHMQRLAPVLYMNDAGRAGSSPLSARWRVAMLMKRRAPLVTGSAVFGITGANRLVAMTLLRASGRSDRVKVCNTRTEAEAWLLSVGNGQRSPLRA